MRKLAEADLNIVAAYMDDDIREQVASELAPCEPGEFLARYCDLVPDFEDLLEDEFSIELKNGDFFKVNEDEENFTEEERADIEKHQLVRKSAKCGTLAETFSRNYARVPKKLIKKLTPEELGELVDAFHECYEDGKQA